MSAFRTAAEAPRTAAQSRAPTVAVERRSHTSGLLRERKVVRSTESRVTWAHTALSADPPHMKVRLCERAQLEVQLGELHSRSEHRSPFGRQTLGPVLLLQCEKAALRLVLVLNGSIDRRTITPPPFTSPHVNDGKLYHKLRNPFPATSSVLQQVSL